MLKFYYILMTAALSFVFFVLGVTVPILGFFILPFSSVVIIILLLKQDAFSGISGILLSCLLVYEILPAGRIFLIPYVVLILMNSLILYAGIVPGRNRTAVLFDSAVSIAAVSLVFMIILAVNGFQYSGFLGNAALGFPKEVLSAVENVFNRDIYSVVIIAETVFVVLSYSYLSLLSGKYGLKIDKLPVFGKWRIPERAIFILIAALALYAAGRVVKDQTLLLVTENILILVTFAYFVGGMAVGAYLFGRAKAMLWLMWFISFLYPPIAVFLGISDVWFDFRKKRGTENEDNIETGN